MTTYYQDGVVRVTGDAIEVGPRVLPIAELSYVWHERHREPIQTTTRQLGRYGLIASLTVPLVVGAVVLVGLLVAALFTVGLLVSEETSLAVQVGLAAALVAALGAVLFVLLAPISEFPMMALERSYDRGTEIREIWVRWRDRDLLLLRTSDAARFGRIYRAIQRAVELTGG